ncbi:MAG: TatD family hydrolase, partial [Anaerolineae bacterium]|nr:TatD family hydrolase [Anaerolineae bacterium]
MDMQIVDTHVHLQDRKYGSDLELVLERAAEAGVAVCIIPGTTIEDSRRAIELSEKYISRPVAVYAAVGIHPTAAYRLTPQTLRELETLATHPRVVAIGEIGLDYYWPHQPDRAWRCAEPAEQRIALHQQLRLAAEVHLPVIIHDREAHADTLQALSKWVAEDTARTGTLHAYAAGPQWLSQALEIGFFIGMDGPVTYRKAGALHEVAKLVPL